MAQATPAAGDQASVRAIGLGVVAVAAGLSTGWLAARVGIAETLALLLAVPLVALAGRSVWISFATVVGVMSLAPFFVLPVSPGGASPTLFELAVFAAGGGYLAVLVLDRRERVHVDLRLALWLVLGAYLVVAFAMGARHGASADLLRLFGRFGLAFAMFWVTVQLVRNRHDARRLVALLVAGTSAAAAIGLALYAGGPSLTFRVLSKLVPYGYPTERIVRFIEDDPAQAMRAVGTGVDPNAYGGLVMVGLVLATGLALSRRRLAPRWLAWTAVALTGAAVLLTYSRGAWIGATAGVGAIVWFRARTLVPFLLAGAIVAAAAGFGAGVVERLQAGFRLQDQATQERLEEYANALAIIREHAWFGIGYGDAPSPDVGVGVSSIYLLIAEQTGLIGLSAFVIFLVALGYGGWKAFRATDDDLILACGAALVAALTVGLVDHYFFNIRFAHMAALFWILAGLMAAMSAERFVAANREGDAG